MKKKNTSNVTLSELCIDVSRKTNIKGGTVKAVCSSFIETIRCMLDEGREVRIPNFGKFVFHERAMKRTHAVNASDYGKIVVSPSSMKIWFVPNPEWAQEHYIRNAEIPSEMPDGHVLSLLFFPRVVEEYGEDVARLLYKDRFDDAYAKYCCR